MKKSRISQVSSIVVLTALLSLLGGITTMAGEPTPDLPAAVTIEAGVITWEPQIENGGLVLTISGPGDFHLQVGYPSGALPTFEARDGAGSSLPDGVYTYELMFLPTEVPVKYDEEQRGLIGTGKALVQSGSFSILDGGFVIQDRAEGGADREAMLPNDVLHYDDVIITGSLCVGFDCANGESFGYCTEKLKENNLQLCFEDTSVGTFPTNDWKIQINDTTSGGASYFTIWDTDAGRRPFTIEAGAPAHSLYVEDYGRVGLGTSIPYVELHIADGDSPTIRLDQDGSSGWPVQRWDMAGNETNFFIRDVTNGSKLTFRIQPNTPSNTLCLRNTGYVGIGTWSPAYPLEVERTGSNAIVALDRTDGATAKFAATLNKTLFGSVTNHKVQILINDASVAEFEVDGDLSINGVLHEGSDVNAKENFAAVDGQEVLARLGDVPITTWTFKASEDGARHMGPTAQDFYAAYGLGSDDKHISALDTSGVALVAIKSLNETVEEKDAQIKALQEQNAELEARLSALEQAVGAQPGPQGSFSSLLPWILIGILLVGIGLLGGVVLMTRRQLHSGKGQLA